MIDQGKLYEDDPSIRRGEDGKWYHRPYAYYPKLAFLICSLLVFAAGGITIWPPFSRLVFGDTNTARVVEIVRSETGKAPETIRYRKNIPEGDIDTIFEYTVEIQLKDSESRLAQLAVGSRRNAFANVNDSFEVISFPNESFAFQLYEHRTWAFGASFLIIGIILTACAIPTLIAVGKPILIDPEAPREEDEENDSK